LYSAYYTASKLRDQSTFLPMLFHLTLIAVLVALALDPSAKASFAGSPQRPNVKDANNLPFTNAKRLALRLSLLPPRRGMYSSSRKGQNLRAHKIVAYSAWHSCFFGVDIDTAAGRVCFPTVDSLFTDPDFQQPYMQHPRTLPPAWGLYQSHIDRRF
jgi:hypothetical protein